MKRRDFIKTGTAATGLMASMKISPLLAAVEKKSSKTEIIEALTKLRDTGFRISNAVINEVTNDL